MRVACLFVIVALVAASALSLASASPVERRELVTVETGMAVDPIGVVRSVTLTTGVSFNAFCEFIVPFLDFELPPGVCSNDLFDNRGRLMKRRLQMVRKTTRQTSSRKPGSRVEGEAGGADRRAACDPCTEGSSQSELSFD